MKRIRVDQTVIVLGILVVVIIVGAILVATVGPQLLQPRQHPRHPHRHERAGPRGHRPDARHPGRVARPLGRLRHEPCASLIAATTMNGNAANIPWAVTLTLLRLRSDRPGQRPRS